MEAENYFVISLQLQQQVDSLNRWKAAMTASRKENISGQERELLLEFEEEIEKR